MVYVFSMKHGLFYVIWYDQCGRHFIPIYFGVNFTLSFLQCAADYHVVITLCSAFLCHVSSLQNVAVATVHRMRMFLHNSSVSSSQEKQQNQQQQHAAAAAAAATEAPGQRSTEGRMKDWGNVR